ncbi:UNVERIFIED_CONTAM: hypothetical protein FKN15_039416 [Acipenser sinensis]
MRCVKKERNCSSCSEILHGDVLKVCGMIAFIVAIILGNVVSLMVFLGSKRFRTPQGYLKASLALADLAVGVLVVPYSAYREIATLLQVKDCNEALSTAVWGFHPCHVIGPVFAGCTFVSITTIFLLCIERSITVLKPLHKNLFVTKKRTIALIAFSWFLCFFLAVVPLLFSQDILLHYSPCSRMCNYVFSTGESARTSTGWNVILLFPTFDFSLLGGTFVINLITFAAIRQFSKARKQLAQPKVQGISNRPSFSDIKAAKTIAILTVSFSACFGPIAVFVVGSVLGYQWCEFSFYAFWILTSNSCWNVIIYSARDRKFRRRTRELFFRKVLKRKRRCPGSNAGTAGHCGALLKEILHHECA